MFLVVYGDTWRPTATLELDWAVKTHQPAAGSVSATLTEKEKEDPCKSPTEWQHSDKTVKNTLRHLMGLHSDSSVSSAICILFLIWTVYELRRSNWVPV